MFWSIFRESFIAATKQTFTVYELNEFDRDSPAFLELSRQSVNKIDPETGAHIKALGDQVPFTNKVNANSISSSQLFTRIANHLTIEMLAFTGLSTSNCASL